MPDGYFKQLWDILFAGTLDTVFMVALSSLFAIAIGTALGITLFITAGGGVCQAPKTNRLLGAVVNIGRSIPFVIIIIAVFPLSRFIVGSSIGRAAAVVPLTIAAAPFVARLVEGAFNELGRGIVEAAISAGATPMQIIFSVLLPESAPSLINGVTLTIINLIGYSAMAGTIGGGGLGDVAIRYGYQRFRTDILVLTIVILIVLVQLIQTLGRLISQKFDKR